MRANREEREREGVPVAVRAPPVARRGIAHGVEEALALGVREELFERFGDLQAVGDCCYSFEKEKRRLI